MNNNTNGHWEQWRFRRESKNWLTGATVWADQWEYKWIWKPARKPSSIGEIIFIGIITTTILVCSAILCYQNMP